MTNSSYKSIYLPKIPSNSKMSVYPGPGGNGKISVFPPPNLKLADGNGTHLAPVKQDSVASSQAMKNIGISTQI